MLDFFNILVSGCGPFSEAEFKLVAQLYQFFLFATPAVVMALCTVDIAKAVMAQDDNAIKKAQNNALKRLIAGTAIFFVPVFINIILGMTFKTYDENGNVLNKVNLGEKKCISQANDPIN